MAERGANFAREDGERRPASLVDGTLVNLGGFRTNDLNLLASVNLDESPELRQGLSEVLDREIDEETANAAFMSSRFFDAFVSRRNQEPLFGFADTVIVSTYDETDRGNAVNVFQVDRVRARQIFSGEVAPWTKRLVAEIDKTVPNRRGRVEGYLRNLVCRGDDRAKAYLRFELEPFDPVDARDEYDEVFRGLTYERASLSAEATVEPTDEPETQAMRRQLDEEDEGWVDEDPIEPPPSTDDQQNNGMFVPKNLPQYTVRGAWDPYIEWKPEGGPTGTWGNPNNTAGIRFNCSGFDQRDECKNCCITNEALALGGVLSAALACHISSNICIPCHIICGLIEAAAAGVIIHQAGKCHENCGWNVRTPQ